MDTYDISIQTLVYGGNGLGRLPDGKAIFVPFVLPGEVARVRVREEKKRHAFGELVEVLEASPQRIAPKCSHYGVCGGCHFQHIPYAQQAQFKQSIFKEQLERIGGIEQMPKIRFIEAPQMWNYRNTIQFHTTGDGELAFMDAANAHPFAVEECWLPMAQIGETWPEISLGGEAVFERLEIRQNSAGEVLMVMHGDNSEMPEIELTLPISVVHINEEDDVVISGDPYLDQTVNGVSFRVSAGSFFQTNLTGAATLVDAVREMTSGIDGTLLDLYCGVGLFSRFLAEQFDAVIGVELSDSACADFVENMANFDHVSLYQGAVEEALKEIDPAVDCVIVDPPRRGIDRFALDTLGESGAPVIIYVSCDPSTLARDVKRLAKSGYVLKESVIVDMFPQTYHMEAVNLLRLA